MYWERDGYSIDELALLAARLESTTEEAERSAGITTAGRSPRRRWVLIGAPLVLTLAACAAVLFSGGGSVDKPAPLPNLTKAAAIHKIAGAAELGKVPFPTVNQYFHTIRDSRRVTGVTRPSDPLDGKSPMVEYEQNVVERNENWTSFYRTGAGIVTTTSLEYASPKDREIARASSAPDEFPEKPQSYKQTNDPMGTVYIGGEKVSREELASYPTDPTEIYKRINSSPTVDFRAGSENLWASLIEAMNIYALPPKLRAAMVETVGLIPGVKSLGPQRDNLGREGYAFSYDSKRDGRRATVILDPKTAMVLHYKAVSLKDPSKVLDDSTLVEADVVDELPPELEKLIATGRQPRPAISQTKRIIDDAKRRDAAAIAARNK